VSLKFADLGNPKTGNAILLEYCGLID
jgi:hypothetical protein